MSRKTLLFNKFGYSILRELDSFYFFVTCNREAYPLTANKPDVNKLCFRWVWNGYEGYGEIDYFKTTCKVCNVRGEDFSNMTISSKSKRQQPNGRHNCALYNDKTLKALFNMILSQVNLNNVLSYDVWLSQLKN